MNTKKIWGWLGGIGAGIFSTMTLVATGAFLHARHPKLEVQILNIPARKKNFPTNNCKWQKNNQPTEEITILHLSDLHLWSKQKWLIKYCQQLALLHPNLVVLTGDNFYDSTGLPALKIALSKLTKFPGVYVWGSNDFYSGVFKLPTKYFFPQHPTKKLRQPDLPTADFNQWLQEAGWIDLNNQVAELEINGWNIALSGVEDPHINRDRKIHFPANWNNADLRLALTHAPYARILNVYASAYANLVLAGHTHGGQICLPGNKALTNNTDIPLQFSQGLFTWDRDHPLPMRPCTPRSGALPLPDLPAIKQSFSDLPSFYTESLETWIGVTPGLGTSKFVPFRIFCPPKANLYRVRLFR